VDPYEALAGFGPATVRWFTDCFDAPTRVQAEGWPLLRQGEHTLMVAPTGSGKTLAAFLAALDATSRLPADAPDGVRVLYVSPLKALVHDIDRNLRSPLIGIERAAAALGLHHRPLRVDVRTGDTLARERQRQSRRPADILVTTPESLYLLLTSQARETLRSVQTVIVDEIHVLAGTKRGVHLALSLERLSALCERDPQRIGLSATQRPLEAAGRFLAGDRPVRIVDTAQPPRLDLQIVVPVEDMERPPRPPAIVTADPGEPVHPAGATQYPGGTLQSGIWPSIHPRLLALIRAHRSTIVFVNSRILCERLVQALNELAGEEIVRAHHGSLSHTQRTQVEEALKAGRVPCIVATSSLELGIDMGAVDLVVLVESPGSTSSGLQRVGRAGHQVGAVSIGRIFPKFRGDLLEAAVVSGQMIAGEIETTRSPTNCLDVLAQQITAMVSMEDWGVTALHALVRRASPYASLTRDLLISVLDMLSGRYPSDAFAELTPTLTWDRTSDLLQARRGARMLAVLNGGTIPDRGLYRVHLGADGPRLGELDEEMVFESRQGDRIILGATTWRIDEITRDRVVVSPAPGESGRLPFWRGERPGRPIELGRALGAFLRELTSREEDEALTWLKQTRPLDDLAAQNLIAYVRDQRAATGQVPTDRTIVVERFRDELGDWRVCILTPFGSRVHAPWALALGAALTDAAGFEVQTFWSDDGIALRLSDSDETPSLDKLFPDPETVEDCLVEQLRGSSLFAARFRESAARALLLPRRRATGRTPLWMQRKRAADLLATASRFPAFPIVLETYRECLQDAFDLPALIELLTAVRRREVAVHDVQTATPSPFARSLVFQYVAAWLYDGDAPLAERKAQALSLDRDLLRELLGQEQLRDLLDPDAVLAIEQELQRLTPDRLARHIDAVHDLLRRLGDLTTEEIAARCEGASKSWIEELVASRRAVRVRIRGEHRFVAVEDAARYRDALGIGLPPGLPTTFLDPVDDAVEGLILRYARTHGPFLSEELAGRYGWTVAQVEAWLRGLTHTGALVHGELRPGGHRREWCDPEVLRRLRRRSLAVLRQQIEPVSPEVLARFLPAWHGLDAPREGLPRLLEVIAQLEGVPLPFSALESRILPARVRGYQPLLLDTAGAMGQVVWLGRGALGAKDGRIALYLREHAPLLIDPPIEAEVGPLHQTLLRHLRERGASFLTELQQAAGEGSKDVAAALWDLVWAGRLTNDTFAPLRSLAAPVRQAAGRSMTRIAGGRWSLVESLLDPEVTDTERLHARVNSLLERHGVLTREAAQGEELPGGFTAIYPVLRAMEESGRLRRGYFIEGLGGAQFALPGAVDRLRAHREEEGKARVLDATDPANPWGATLPWPPTCEESVRPRRVPGAEVVTVDGRPTLYLSPGGGAMILFRVVEEDPTVLEKAVVGLRASNGYRSLQVEKVDGVEAAASPRLGSLLKVGFGRDYKGLVLAGR
jgi:ATP-dependent Lhr-like helicase